MSQQCSSLLWWGWVQEQGAGNFRTTPGHTHIHCPCCVLKRPLCEPQECLLPLKTSLQWDHLAQPPYKIFVSRWSTFWSTGELRPNKGMLKQYYVDILTEGIPGVISRKAWGLNTSSTSEAEVEESWDWSHCGKSRKQVNDSNNSNSKNNNRSTIAIE